MQLCAGLEELARLPAGPKVVLAGLPSLEAGPGRHLLAQWAADPASLILFTGQAQVELAYSCMHAARSG
jgi:hypothetical protein